MYPVGPGRLRAARVTHLSLDRAHRPAGVHSGVVFTRSLREGVRRGRIRCSIRIWQRPRVRVGGRYPMEEGHVVVDSIEPITLEDVTEDLARESGFASVGALLDVARHGSGRNVYLVRFHYLPPGGWEL